MSVSPSRPSTPPPAGGFDLSNIFDSPTPPRPANATSRAANPLFYDASPTASPTSRRGSPPPGRGGNALEQAMGLFDNLSDDDELGAGAGGGAGARAGLAAGEGSDGENGDSAGIKAVPKRVIAKIDAARLLGPNGIPRLAKDSKKIKFKGKGHENEDLKNLMGYYHLWAHQLFPKTKFKDTVIKVEKVCRERRMLSALSQFRDEANPAPALSPPRDLDQPEADAHANQSPSRRSRSRSRSHSPTAASSRPTQRRRVVDSDEEEDAMIAAAEADQRQPNGTSTTQQDDFDDMDELIATAEAEAREEERLKGEIARDHAQTAPPPPPPPIATTTASTGVNEYGEDEEDWSILDDMDEGVGAGSGAVVGGAGVAATSAAQLSRSDVEEDDDDWAAMEGM